MSYELFWYGDAETYWAYQTAFINKEKYEQEKENNISWLRGLYIFDALSASSSNANRSKESDEVRYYMDKPIDFNKNLKETIEQKNKDLAQQRFKAYIHSKKILIDRINHNRK
jgi:hypothetical protein